MKSWTVYKHISPSGKVYVGISSNVKNRWAANGYYYHSSDTVFSRALKKYGWENFEHIILQNGLTKEEACNMEKELIAYYKAKDISYNITDGGDGTSGFKPSNEQIANRIASRIANNDNEYLVIDKDYNYIVCQTVAEAATYLGGTQRNISNLLCQPIGYTFRKHYIWKYKKGTTIDIECIKKQIEKALYIRKKKMSAHTKAISAKMVEASRRERQSLSEEERKKRYHRKRVKGWHHSEETKRKMALKAQGRDMSKAIEASRRVPHNPVNKKNVIQYKITGEFVKEFISINQAAIETGIGYSSIVNCLKGRSNSSGGYKWQYKN